MCQVGSWIIVLKATSVSAQYRVTKRVGSQSQAAKVLQARPGRNIRAGAKLGPIVSATTVKYFRSALPGYASIVTRCFFADSPGPLVRCFVLRSSTVTAFVPPRPFALSFAASLAASQPCFLPASHALIVLVKRKSPMDERTRGRSRPRRRPCLSRPLVPQKENPQRMIQVSSFDSQVFHVLLNIP